tara:strand:- start:631 stop:1338 length:708 start_codon:yes stop_codon:yes gene_type:complete
MTEISLNSYLKFIKKSGISYFLQNEPNNLYKKNQNGKNPNKIEEVNNIKDLELFIKKSNNCSLKKDANNSVVGDGNEKANIMLIGEAPGAEEDKIGKPFVGAAGQLLTKMLKAINIDRKEIYISNIIPWRPPNNRTPTNKEIMECLPFIQKNIEIIDPKIIILLGATAAKAVLNSNLAISNLRKKWHTYQTINDKKEILCLVTYHPAFLLRSPNFKKQSWEDLKIIERKIENENL